MRTMKKKDMGRSLWIGLMVAAGLGLCLPTVAEAGVSKKTERIWKAKCSSCHGKDGKAQTEQGKKLEVRDMTTADWQEAVDDAAIKEAILNGAKGKTAAGEETEMKPYKGKVKDKDLDGLVEYIRGLAPPAEG